MALVDLLGLPSRLAIRWMMTTMRLAAAETVDAVVGPGLIVIDAVAIWNFQTD